MSLKSSDRIDRSFAPATRFAPQMLAILRIMTGLLIMQHGLQKLFGFPTAPGSGIPALFSLMGFAGVLELVGGILIVLGLFTRPTAFVLAGFTAVAYFMAHAARNFFPVVNGGELAILFCFVFLYLVTAGPGAWSLDGRLRGGWRSRY